MRWPRRGERWSRSDLHWLNAQPGIDGFVILANPRFRDFGSFERAALIWVIARREQRNHHLSFPSLESWTSLLLHGVMPLAREDAGNIDLQSFIGRYPAARVHNPAKLRLSGSYHTVRRKFARRSTRRYTVLLDYSVSKAILALRECINPATAEQHATLQRSMVMKLAKSTRHTCPR